jgi:hypothetical protein
MKIINSWNATFSALALAAACATGCVASDDDTGNPADDSDLVGQTSQAISGRYCVDQSSASVGFYDSDRLFLTCQAQPIWGGSIGRDHPVNVHDDCGTYVRVKDLWGTSSWVMRRDALRPC